MIRKYQHVTPPKSAFSLVELSIVLVILGLLVGGVLTGQSLIRAAELRSVTTEFEKYQAAVHTFRDKYFALPGDMSNATSFWGQMTNCGAASPSGTGTQTCNGNSTGTVDGPAAAAQTGEYFTFWQHLVNAGLIEGSYTGIAGTGGFAEAIGAQNVPKSKVSNGIWFTNYWGNSTGSPDLYNGAYGNALRIGGQATGGGNNTPIFSPEEMWNIDTKTDDGLPALGKIRPRFRVGCTVKANGAVQTTGAADAALLDSKYDLLSTSHLCSIIFCNLY